MHIVNGVFVNLDAHRGARLREERERLGMSQQAMADAIGIRREMWAKYEAGAEPGAGSLSGMAGVGVDVLYVLTGQRGGGDQVALSAEEQVLVEHYRAASKEARKATLGALFGASVTGPRSVVIHGSVGQQVESGALQTGVRIFMGGKKKG